MPLRGILQTGSNFQGQSGLSGISRRGLTFIEVMVTVVILSAGLVAIYRSFFTAVDQLQYLSCRLYANNLLETKIARIEKDFRDLKDFDIGVLTEQAEIDGRTVEFRYAVDLKPVGSLLSIFELDVALSWEDRGRTVTIGRSAYFSGITSLTPQGS